MEQIGAVRVDLPPRRGRQFPGHALVDGAGWKNSELGRGGSPGGWRIELYDECSSHLEDVGKPFPGRGVLNAGLNPA